MANPRTHAARLPQALVRLVGITALLAIAVQAQAQKADVPELTVFEDDGAKPVSFAVQPIKEPDSGTLAGPSRALRPGFCSLRPAVGECRASMLNFFYNPSSDACEEFVWGGCGGNDNRFESLEACQRMCATGPTYRPSLPEAAPLPVVNPGAPSNPVPSPTPSPDISESSPAPATVPSPQPVAAPEAPEPSATAEVAHTRLAVLALVALLALGMISLA